MQRIDDTMGDPTGMASTPRRASGVVVHYSVYLSRNMSATPGLSLPGSVTTSLRSASPTGTRRGASVFAERSFKVRVIGKGDETPEG
jgi:hypothetical protein